MANFQIDQFEFINLSQAAIPPKDMIAIHSRPGVEGVELRRTGKRGEKFTVRTLADAADKDAALALYKQYLTLIDEGPVDFIFLGATEPHKVQVLDVQPVPGEIRAVLFALGPSGTASYGWCACDWTLIEITPVEER
jgi:hypothetical protein